MRSLILAAVAALALAGCATQPAVVTAVATPTFTSATSAPIIVTPTPDPLAQIAAFTTADLQAAQTDAIANNDTVAAACYPALNRFVQSLPAGVGNVQGAITAFQKARDLRLSVQTGLPSYLKLGCAALLVDEQTLIAKLAALGGGAAILAPVAPLLPALMP